MTGLPARSRIHCLASSHVELSLRRPAFPRLLMSWSGLATSFSVKTHDGSLLSGVMVSVSGSQRICWGGVAVARAIRPRRVTVSATSANGQGEEGRTRASSYCDCPSVRLYVGERDGASIPPDKSVSTTSSLTWATFTAGCW